MGPARVKGLGLSNVGILALSVGIIVDADTIHGHANMTLQQGCVGVAVEVKEGVSTIVLTDGR